MRKIDFRIWRIPVLLLLMLPHAFAANPAGRVELWLDRSGSAADSELADVLGDVVARVPELASRNGLYHWDLFLFYGNTFTARPNAAFDLPLFTPPACENHPAGEAGRILRRIDESNRAQQQRKCLADQDAAQTAWRKAVDDTARAKLKLAPAPVASARPGCTALVQLVQRISRESGSNPTRILILTDGEESCVRNPPAIPSPKPNVRAVMAVVTGIRAASDPYRHFVDVENYWKRIAPWIRVVPATELDPLLAILP